MEIENKKIIEALPSGKIANGCVKNSNLWLLNVIRGISALLIVCYHYTTQYQTSIGHLEPYRLSVPWGCYAVSTFFMLSGFLTVYAYKKNETTKQYLTKRAIRLYPVFWIAIIITTLYMILLFPERVVSAKDLICNFTMLPGVLGAKPVDGVYWTLQRELLFYIAFAILVFIKKTDKLRYWQLIWLAMSAAAAVYCNPTIDFPLQGLVSLLLLPDCMFAFISGISIYYLRYSDENKIKIISIFTLLGCLVNCFVVKSFDQTIYLFISVLFVYICSDKRVNQRLCRFEYVAKPLIYVATISYPLYLTHQYIGFALIQKLELLGLVSEIWIIIPIAQAIILAALIHQFVEKPVTGLLKKRINKTLEASN